MGIGPTLDLSTVATAEHAHDSCLRIDALAARAHDAQGARVIVASEHVVLDEPEVLRAKTIEPGLNIAPRRDGGHQHRDLYGDRRDRRCSATELGRVLPFERAVHRCSRLSCDLADRANKKARHGCHANRLLDRLLGFASTVPVRLRYGCESPLAAGVTPG